MNIEELLKRANLTKIHLFLQHGSEWLSETSKATYANQIRDSEIRTAKFFEERFPELDEQEKVINLFDNETAVYKDIYFEVGLLIGAKIGYDLHGRMKEIGL